MAFSKSARDARQVCWDNDFPINWAFFSNPSNALYYFLGYLAGDGVCCSDERQTNIGSIDGYIIEKFRDLFASKHGIAKDYYVRVDGSKGVLCKLSIGKKSFWSLISSYDVKSPSIFSRIPVPFLPSFIRGFLDSEGNVDLIEEKTCLGIVVSFSQKSKLYLEALSSVLRAWSLDPAPIYCDVGESHVLRLRLEDSLLLLEKLYVDKGDLYLRRKYNNYMQVLNSRSGLSVFKIRSDAMRKGYETKCEKLQKCCV